MKKNQTRRLQLRRSTLRTLSDGELGQVAGGTLYYYHYYSVYYTVGSYVALPAGSLPPTGGTVSDSCP